MARVLAVSRGRVTIGTRAMLVQYIEFNHPEEEVNVRSDMLLGKSLLAKTTITAAPS
jgi:hypothetical protein